MFFSHRNLFFFRKDATLFEEQRWYPHMMRISFPPSKMFNLVDEKERESLLLLHIHGSVMENFNSAPTF